MLGIFTCKDCPSRYPGCHDKCERYQAEKKSYEEAKELKRQQDAVRKSLDVQRSTSVYRALRKHNPGR